MGGQQCPLIIGGKKAMTYGEVKRQILNLGFESFDTYDEEPTILVDAINRAMREITNLFPIIGSYQIAQYPLPNLLGGPCPYMDVKHYDGKNPLQYAASGAKALYFEYTGTVTIAIRDDAGTRTVTLNGGRSFQEHREFVAGDVTMSFSGLYSYDIKNIAVYAETYSDVLSDIPAYRKHIRYDFRELTAQAGKRVFIDFMDQVMEGDYSSGNAYQSIRDFQVEKRSILVLDGTKKAEYTIFYKKNFTPVTEATSDDFEFELDYDKEPLLPLLAAFYVWADDDPNKAAIYKNDYEDLAAQLLSLATSDTATEAFVNNLGW
jgi:hypothetical protein